MTDALRLAQKNNPKLGDAMKDARDVLRQLGNQLRESTGQEHIFLFDTRQGTIYVVEPIPESKM